MLHKTVRGFASLLPELTLRSKADMPPAQPPEMPSRRAQPGFVARRLCELAQSLRFYSRLPVPNLPFEQDAHGAPDLAKAFWSVPLVGAVLGACGAGIGFLALMIGLPPLLSAALAITALVIVTGCFHEDGLADSADGLWGGMTIERRLEIMRDSRIGTYGGAALVLSLILRVSALSELVKLQGTSALLLLIGIGAISRVFSLVLGFMSRPARQDGVLIATSGAMHRASILIGLVLGGVSFILALHAGRRSDFSDGLVLIALAALIVVLSAKLAKAKLGGVTGDILGATQQLIEIGLLVACFAVLS
jgi:adenosylcobinamide-GDP ribazoletransferase